MRKDLRIVNKLGLHMRAANLFATVAGRYEASIRVIKGDLAVNGKSIMGLMMLAAPEGSILVLEAEGKDEEAAINELFDLVRTGFGEDGDG